VSVTRQGFVAPSVSEGERERTRSLTLTATFAGGGRSSCTQGCMQRILPALTTIQAGDKYADI
jgi:hypothetical protein